MICRNFDHVIQILHCQSPKIAQWRGTSCDITIIFKIIPYHFQVCMSLLVDLLTRTFTELSALSVNHRCS